MSNNFKDHFSGNSDAYNEFRPLYPDELYSYLSTLCKDHERAWDCATGTGQAAVKLASYFSEVVATDASNTQIENATKSDKVIYRIAQSESSGIENNSMDLITVAQAVHWFDLDAFRIEVDRVLKPGGILAIWTYKQLAINKEIDRAVSHLYGPLLDSYWPKERRYIEEDYKNISFPYELIAPPQFAMTTEWSLSHLVGYLNTWSAVKKYVHQNGSNPVEENYQELSAAWGDTDTIYKVSWPLTLLLWRKSA